MLAPRKTLHSTPLRVFRTALEIVHASPNDVLYDIGCGDGRCVIEAASRFGIRSVGIEIDPDRTEVARHAVETAGVTHLVKIHHGNAMEFDFEEATIIFLFLIERGLKLIRPKLEQRTKPCRVVTYLYKFPDLPYQSKHFVRVKETDDDVAFPIFVYEFPCSSMATESWAH